MALTIEIEKMSIIVATRIPLKQLLERTVKSKFTGEQVTYVRKNPYITQDPDTCSFIKYWLYAKVKRNVFRETRYDEMIPFVFGQSY